MSKEALVLIAAHLPLLYWLVVVDRFRSWNRWADGIEDWCFPRCGRGLDLRRLLLCA